MHRMSLPSQGMNPPQLRLLLSKRMQHSQGGPANVGLLGKVANFGRKNPFIFQLGIATMKTCLADLLVQMTIDERSIFEIDWKRNGTFVLFGFGYLGCIQYFFYVKCMRALWPAMDRFAAWPTLRQKLADKAGLRALVGQVFTDCFIFTPFFYFPTFYSFKQVMQGDEDHTIPQHISAALQTYRQNALHDNFAFWRLWLPLDFVIYTFPIWLRLPSVHFVSLTWTCILSYLRGGSNHTKKIADKPPVASVPIPAPEVAIITSAVKNVA